MTHKSLSPTRSLYSNQLIADDAINAEITLLAQKIINDFRDQHPLFVCLLRGGMPFSTRLMFAIAKQDPYFHPELDYMTVSSYGTEQTAREPRIVMDLGPKTIVHDRPVIVLDDMIDKGNTYLFTKQVLQEKGAKSVTLAVLIQRKLASRSFNADYRCFSIDSDAWLTGMGLDDSRLGTEANRWASFVAEANPAP